MPFTTPPDPSPSRGQDNATFSGLVAQWVAWFKVFVQELDQSIIDIDQDVVDTQAARDEAVALVAAAGGSTTPGEADLAREALGIFGAELEIERVEMNGTTNFVQLGANVDLSEYDILVLRCADFQPTAAGQITLYFTKLDDNDDLVVANYKTLVFGAYSPNVGVSATSDTLPGFQISESAVGADKFNDFNLEITGHANANVHTRMRGWVHYFVTSGVQVHYNLAGIYSQANQIKAVNIRAEVGNLAGKVALYGRKL